MIWLYLCARKRPEERGLERAINVMGTSFSAPRDENRTLPTELVIKILSYLSLHDLVSCRLVDRELNDIINGSALQYQIDTAIVGVVDNPSSTLSLDARRRAPARRQVAWDTCQPQKTISESMKGDYMDITPKYDRNETLLRSNLREKGGYKFISLAICDNNDLIAMGSLKPLINSTGSHGPDPFHLDSFDVDLLSISRGGGEHPAARKSTLHIKNISRDNRWETQMEIHTNLLAVHFRCVSSRSGFGVFRELWVLDWKTGEKLAFWKDKGYSAFQFLSNTVIAIGSELSPTAVLELFTIPVLTGNAGPAPMTKILSLGLPRVDDGFHVARLNFYHPPIENVFIREDCLFLNTTTHTKPFISTSSDDIIFATLNIGTRYGHYDNISFVVHSSALLHLIPFPPHGHMRDTIPWESWGPTVTRWHEDIVGRLSPFASGQRCILKPEFRPGTRMWELWDFNPYRVRRLGKNFTLESEKASLSVETKPSCAKSRGIKEGVYSSLPFVKIIPKQWSNYVDMGIYDDQICGKRLDSVDHIVDHLYFG